VRTQRAAPRPWARRRHHGSHVAFAKGRFDPNGNAGRDLLAHELAHVVQQTHPDLGAPVAAAGALEAQADRAAGFALGHSAIRPNFSAASHAVQRRVEMRDVGRGEFSGFARLPDLIERLDGISPSLLFTVIGGVLTYTVVEGLTPNDFDRQMIASSMLAEVTRAPD
jgi:hypothetical protein